MRFSEICSKQVVNMKDGSIIGKVHDAEIYREDLCIKSLYVVECAGFINRMLPWLFPMEEIEIPISDIVHIGEDVIMVKLSC